MMTTPGTATTRYTVSFSGGGGGERGGRTNSYTKDWGWGGGLSAEIGGWQDFRLSRVWPSDDDNTRHCYHQVHCLFKWGGGGGGAGGGRTNRYTKDWGWGGGLSAEIGGWQDFRLSRVRPSDDDNTRDC